MMKTLFGAFLLTFLMIYPSRVGADERPTVSVAWSLEADFKSPESATISEKHNAIFVSNVNGYEKNGAGFISRLSLDGKLDKLVWLKGINAPTGLKAVGDTLWVVDFDRLLKIDIPSARVVSAYPAPDKSPLLNDVAIGLQGMVFVTGSESNTVYQLVNGELQIWVRDDELLRFANGIMVTADAVVVAAYHLINIDRNSKTKTILGPKETLYDLEGVMPDGKDGYIISVIGNRPIYQLDKEGAVAPIYQSDPYFADFDISGDLLVGPSGPNRITGLKLPR